MDSKQALLFFAKFIEEHTGIVYSEVTFFQLEARLKAIAIQLGIESIEVLSKKAQTEGIKGDFKTLLLDLATNNETSFFRDAGVFDGIVGQVVPALLDARVSKLKIWSAASSTGQEALSLAIALDEMMRKGRAFDFEIHCTDLSQRVLNRARKGLYTQLEAQRGLSAQRLLEYFDSIADAGDGYTWKVKENLLKKMSFAPLNLIDPWPRHLGPFHLILCRNVLIYQNVEQKKLVIQKIYQHLETNGWLVLGGAESLVGLSQQFTQVQVGSSIFYKPVLDAAAARA